MIEPFALHRPETVEEAHQLFVELNGAVFFAGGTELIQTMKLGIRSIGHLIDLKSIAGIPGIERHDGRLIIGATVTHAEIESSSLVHEANRALSDLERMLGNPRVRSIGTLGGNLCAAQSHWDPAPLLIACGADLELATGSHRRSVSVADFISAPGKTTRIPGEVLVAISIPTLREGTAVVHKKLGASQRSNASVAVRLFMEDDRIKEASVIVGTLRRAPSAIPKASQVVIDVDRNQSSEAFRESAKVASDFTAPGSNETECCERRVVRILVERALVDAYGKLYTNA